MWVRIISMLFVKSFQKKSRNIFTNISSFRIFLSYSGPVAVLILCIRAVQGPFPLSYLDDHHRTPEGTIKLPSAILPLICGFESSRGCLSSPFRKKSRNIFNNISSFRIFLSYSGPVAVLILCLRAVQGPFPLSYRGPAVHLTSCLGSAISSKIKLRFARR